MKKNIKGKNLVPVTITDLNLDDEPNKNSTDPVTSRGVANAISGSANNLLDDEDEATTEITEKGDSSFAADFTVGHYYVRNNQIFLCTDISHEGAVYTVTLEKENGVVPVFNSLVDRIKALET